MLESTEGVIQWREDAKLACFFCHVSVAAAISSDRDVKGVDLFLSPEDW